MIALKGCELTTEVLRIGYGQQAFPMTEEDGEVCWYQTTGRAVFLNCEMHVSRSLRKRLDRQDLEVTFDCDFEGVMRACFREEGNWLSDDFVRVYGEAHREGWGHSCEVWREKQLVGGVYGLAIGGCFCAESMFHREPNMSKIALYFLLKKCHELGFHYVDAQIMNSHLASLGCVMVSESERVQMWRRSQTISPVWI